MTWGLLVGCAAQSPPRPPRIERPETVKDLTAAQVGQIIDLHFTAPDKATDGQGLTKPLEIDLFRAAAPPGGKAAPAPSAPPLAVLKGSDLARLTSAGKLEYRDSLNRAEFQRLVGGFLTYQLRGLTRGFRGRPIESAPSNTAILRLLNVPEAPSGLAVDVTASALQLHWSAPSRTVTGQPVSAAGRYRIYRSDTGTPGSYTAVGESPDTSFSDASFDFGHLYVYRVRALITEASQSAESADSPAVEIVPRDVFPPAAPAGLSGVYTGKEVDLIWSPNTEADLAGYNIYRNTAGEKPVKLNAELLRSPLYRDTTATAGHRYTYRVTAMDTNDNESVPSEEAVVDVP
ncbi:MAG TPA: hypothetical protein VGZ29_14780 [Terriglobia bacterium]|nr:hypothetical protein [Terriglobia bacterium]